MLIFLQGLLDDSHALLVRLSGSVSLEWTQLFSPKAGDPHVPIPLEDNLDFDIIMFESVTTIFYLYIPHIDVIGLPVLGKGASLADSMLYEVISNLKRKHATTTKRAEKLVSRTVLYLKEDVFHILVQLLSRINFLYQLTQPFLVQNLSHGLRLNFSPPGKST